MIDRLSLRTVLNEKSEKKDKGLSKKQGDEKAKEFINALDKDWKCGSVRIIITAMMMVERIILNYLLIVI